MRYSLILLSLFASLNAIELDIKPESNVTASEKEVKMTEDIYISEGMKTNHDKLATFISNNRALANAYLKKHEPLDYAYITSLKHKVENIIAQDMVKEIQENVKLEDNEDILKSYYLEHRSEHMQKEAYDYHFIDFNTFEEALAFYQANKADASDTLTQAKEVNATTTFFEKVPFNKSYYSVEKLRDKDKLPQLLAPQFIETYTVILITKFTPAKPIPFKVMKQGIANYLYKKTFDETRDKVIKDMQRAK